MLHITDVMLNGYLDFELFTQFARNGALYRLIGFLLTSREFPKAAE